MFMEPAMQIFGKIFLLIIIIIMPWMMTCGANNNFSKFKKIHHKSAAPTAAAPLHEQNINHNIIFCGDLSQWAMWDYHKIFGKSQYSSVQSKDCILQPLRGTDANLIVFMMIRSSTNNLFSAIKQIAKISEPVGHHRKTPVIFFICWSPPQMMDIQEEIGRIISENMNVTQNIRTIPLNHHVYLLPNFLNEIENTQSGFKLFDGILMELYGIMGQKAVVHRLENFLQRTETLSDLLPHLQNFGPRRGDLHGLSLKVVAQPGYPAYINVKVLKNGKVLFKSSGGPNYRILTDFAETLNFRYQPIAGKGWIMQDKDGHPTGLGQQILKKEADLSVSTVSLQEYRARELLYLPPIQAESIGIFFLEPSPTSARNTFTMPFSRGLWLVIFGLAILICGSSSIVAWCRRNRKMSRVNKTNIFLTDACPRSNPYNNCGGLKNERRDSFKPIDAVIFSVGVLCQQGWNSNPESVSLRIIFITSMMMSIVLYIVYTATLVAIISAPNSLVKQYSDLRKFSFDTLVNPSTPNFLVQFIEDKKERENVINHSTNLYKSDENAVTQVVNGVTKTAFISAVNVFFTVGLMSFSSPELCTVSMLTGHKSHVIKYAMFMRKGSEYEELFKLKTISLTERGLNKRYWTAYRQQTRPLCTKNLTKFCQIKFLDCFPALLLLATGTVISLLLLTIEIHWGKSWLR